MRVVFVHGACVRDGSWWWHRAAELLQERGVSSVAPALPSCGEADAPGEDVRHVHVEGDKAGRVEGEGHLCMAVCALIADDGDAGFIGEWGEGEQRDFVGEE